MTSSMQTEDEVLKILLSGPRSFERIIAALTRDRKKRNVKPGSRSTVAEALQDLDKKKLAEYLVAQREWRITSLGWWIVAKDLEFTPASRALTQVTQPLINEIDKRPGQLSDLLSTMFVYFSARGGKPPVSEEILRKQTTAQLTLFNKGYAKAIRAIWIDGVELLIGHFSSLMTAVLLYRSTVLNQDKAVASPTIQKIIEQYFKSVAEEMAVFLSKYLADLEDLAALEARKNEEERLPSHASIGKHR